MKIVKEKEFVKKEAEKKTSLEFDNLVIKTTDGAVIKSALVAVELEGSEGIFAPLYGNPEAAMERATDCLLSVGIGLKTIGMDDDDYVKKGLMLICKQACERYDEMVAVKREEAPDDCDAVYEVRCE